MNIYSLFNIYLFFTKIIHLSLKITYYTRDDNDDNIINNNAIYYLFSIFPKNRINLCFILYIIVIENYYSLLIRKEETEDQLEIVND